MSMNYGDKDTEKLECTYSKSMFYVLDARARVYK